MAQIPDDLCFVRCGIGLGTNVGHRIENLVRATRSVLALVPHSSLSAVGGLYETAPVDCPEGSDSFLNSVIEIETVSPPGTVHRILKEIEIAMGRPPVREKNAPRSIDLDILYFGDLIIDEPELTVPHPRIHLRRFVLRPLGDIRPDLVLPKLNRTVERLLADLQDEPDEVKLVKREWLEGTH